MHIRDGHVRDGEIKQRMKRFFGAQSTAPVAPQAASTTHILQQPSTSVSPSTAEMEMDGAIEIDPGLLQSQAPVTVTADDATNEFNHITGLFARQTREDDDDGDGQMPSVISEIAKLFNFTNKSWIPSHERSASRSLDEELELYELLDLDAPY